LTTSIFSCIIEVVSALFPAKTLAQVFTCMLFFYFFLGYPMNIYVGNLAFGTTEDGLKQLFEQFGSVVSSRIIKDKITGDSRGFAFVEMANDDEANKAIAGLNGTELDGRALRISKAEARTDRPTRPFAPRGGQDRGGRRF
jgi:RNA recognition motif-containing protein